MVVELLLLKRNRVCKEFNSLFAEYYNTNEMESLLKFLYNNCIFGMEI